MTDLEEYDALVDEMWKLCPERCRDNVRQHEGPFPGTALPGELTYTVYAICIDGDPLYVGRTQHPRARWAKHKCSAKTGRSRLYCAMRRAGLERCSFHVMFDKLTKAEACSIEEELVELSFQHDRASLNSTRPAPWFAPGTKTILNKANAVSNRPETGPARADAS